MPEYLALDLESHRVCGVLADVSETGIIITKVFSAAVPADVVNEPPLLGAWLGDALRQQGISARQVLLCLPREEVSIRHLELPPVEDAELPAVVRFQAATKSTVPLDQLALDYLLLPPRSGFAGRDVLSVTVPQERIGKLFSAALTAGLEVFSVGVSSVATAEIVIEAESDGVASRGANETSLVVARHGDRIEISLVGQGHLYFSHSTQADGRIEQTPQQVLAEASRAVVALSKRLPNARISRVWLLGSASEDAELAKAARDRFDCEVTQLDPFKAAGVELRTQMPATSHATFSGPIGQLLGHGARSKTAIDFINPRRPTVRRDFTQQKRWAAVAVAAAITLSALGYRAYAVSQLQDDVAQAQSNLKIDRDRNDKLMSQVVVTERVDDWAATQINWLDETQQLANTMQGTERTYLKRLQFSLGATKALRGTISAKGHGKERPDVEDLSTEVGDPQGVEVEAKPITRKGTDGDFPYEFELIINMKKPDAQPAAAKSPKERGR